MYKGMISAGLIRGCCLTVQYIFSIPHLPFPLNIRALVANYSFPKNLIEALSVIQQPLI